MAIRQESVAAVGSPSPWMRLPGGFSKPNEERLPGRNPTGVASGVGRLFFPHSQALGICPDDMASPAVLRKMVYAGSHASSFEQASNDLKEEAELEISTQRIMRATKQIGRERVEQRNAETEAWSELSLPEQQGSPREQVPQVACVEMDGGRLQIRDRKPSAEEAQKTTRAGFWREDKVGCLLSLTSAVSQEDPCPQIPKVFVDREQMRKVSREIKGFCVSDEEDSVPSERESQTRPGQPEILVRGVVATRKDVHVFGRQLAAAAWQRGFAAAPRKAFVGDGQEANWSVWQTHFSHYTPILDFIHGICYVFAAAVAGRPLRDGWPIYCQWAQWVWSGKVQLVIEALRVRQQALGLPEKDESEESPRSKVADSLRYLENQKSRMHYDQYRRAGLPITSSHIESTIKQINRRVKGSEKFWSEDGAEALLQLAADYLSETKPLTTFWRERPSHASGQRRHRTAA
jgi:hypothetical protein